MKRYFASYADFNKFSNRIFFNLLVRFISGINPCDGAQCGSYQQCAIDRYGIAKCECGPECEPVMRPVCARGGTTYTSLCELKRHACLNKSNIEFAYTGACGSRGPCSDKVSFDSLSKCLRIIEFLEKFEVIEDNYIMLKMKNSLDLIQSIIIIFFFRYIFLMKIIVMRP